MKKADIIHRKFILEMILIPIIGAIFAMIIEIYPAINGDSNKLFFITIMLNCIVATVLTILYINIVKKMRSKEQDSLNSYATVYQKYLINKLGMQKDEITEKDTEFIRSLTNDGKGKKQTPRIKEHTKEDKKINKSNENDIIALMLNNHDEITEYFSISKSQAKSSYWFSVCSCIAGIIMLFAAVFFILSGSLDYAVLGLIGATVTEVLSGTVLWIHNKSALQLNHYYDALHENEKFLSAITIADKLPSDIRVDILCEIIRSQLS